MIRIWVKEQNIRGMWTCIDYCCVQSVSGKIFTIHDMLRKWPLKEDTRIVTETALGK